MKNITIYTDGACSNNPGPGGWACILICGDKTKENCGFVADTTNNRMELTAVIKALEMVKEPCNINLYSDSAYVVNAFLQNWIENWQNNNWKNSQKEKVKNSELWQRLLELSKNHNITWNKVKGHSNNVLNNRCDYLATQQVLINIPPRKEVKMDN